MNQWKSLFEGVTKGAGSFLQGLGKREQKSQAEEVFNKTKNYLETMGLQQQKALQNASDIINPKQDFWGGMANLRSNPYGEPYAKTLEQMYRGMKPDYDYKEVNDVLYQINNRTGEVTPRTQKEQKPLPKTYTQGQIDQMTLEDLESMDTNEIDKIFNFLPSDIQKQWNDKHIIPEEETSRTSRTGSRRRLSVPPIDLQTGDITSKLDKYVKDSHDFNKKFGGWNNDASGQQKESQEYLNEKKAELKSEGLSEDEISLALEKYRRGSLTKKELTSTVKNRGNETKRPQYPQREIDSQKKEIDAVLKKFKENRKKGVGMDEIRKQAVEFYNKNRDLFFPETEEYILGILKKYGIEIG